MARSALANFRAFVEANPGPHICACGCGGQIVLLPAHRKEGIPKFLITHRRNSGTPTQRFWRHVDKEGAGGCWLWTGATRSSGYGHMRSGVGRTVVLAHRFSYELHCGPIPAGLFVLHKCDVKHCVNPEHFFLGTNADNSADKVAKGRQARGERNGVARLTASAVLEIRRRHAAGETVRELAVEYKVSRNTIRNAVNRVCYGHIS